MVGEESDEFKELDRVDHKDEGCSISLMEIDRLLEDNKKLRNQSESIDHSTEEKKSLEKMNLQGKCNGFLTILSQICDLQGNWNCKDSLANS
ncbi:hypothetical protein YC2023_061970 [Brassica napus]